MAGAVLGMQLVLTVVGAIATAAWALVGSFYGVGWWGVPLAVYSLLNTSYAWRALAAGIGDRGVRSTAEGAMALTAFTNLIVAVHLVWRPPAYSPWWGLLVPFAFLLQSMALQLVYAVVLGATGLVDGARGR